MPRREKKNTNGVEKQQRRQTRAFERTRRKPRWPSNGGLFFPSFFSCTFITGFLFFFWMVLREKQKTEGGQRAQANRRRGKRRANARHCMVAPLLDGPVGATPLVPLPVFFSDPHTHTHTYVVVYSLFRPDVSTFFGAVWLLDSSSHMSSSPPPPSMEEIADKGKEKALENVEDVNEQENEDTQAGIRVCLVASLDSTGLMGYGANESIPWKLKGAGQHIAIRGMVGDATVVVGARAALGAFGGRPPGKRVIVLSRRSCPKGLWRDSIVADSVEDVFRKCHDSMLYVLGGAEVLALFMPYASRVQQYILAHPLDAPSDTDPAARPTARTYFPAFASAPDSIVEDAPVHAACNLCYHVARYEFRPTRPTPPPSLPPSTDRMGSGQTDGTIRQRKQAASVRYRTRSNQRRPWGTILGTPSASVPLSTAVARHSAPTRSYTAPNDDDDAQIQEAILLSLGVVQDPHPTLASSSSHSVAGQRHSGQDCVPLPNLPTRRRDMIAYRGQARPSPVPCAADALDEADDLMDESVDGSVDFENDVCEIDDDDNSAHGDDDDKDDTSVVESDIEHRARAGRDKRRNTIGMCPLKYLDLCDLSVVVFVVRHLNAEDMVAMCRASHEARFLLTQLLTYKDDTRAAGLAAIVGSACRDTISLAIGLQKRPLNVVLSPRDLARPSRVGAAWLVLHTLGSMERVADEVEQLVRIYVFDNQGLQPHQHVQPRGGPAGTWPRGGAVRVLTWAIGTRCGGAVRRCLAVVRRIALQARIYARTTPDGVSDRLGLWFSFALFSTNHPRPHSHPSRQGATVVGSRQVEALTETADGWLPALDVACAAGRCRSRLLLRAACLLALDNMHTGTAFVRNGTVLLQMSERARNGPNLVTATVAAHLAEAALQGVAMGRCAVWDPPEPLARPLAGPDSVASDGTTDADARAAFVGEVETALLADTAPLVFDSTRTVTAVAGALGIAVPFDRDPATFVQTLQTLLTAGQDALVSVGQTLYDLVTDDRQRQTASKCTDTLWAAESLGRLIRQVALAKLTLPATPRNPSLSVAHVAAAGTLGNERFDRLWAIALHILLDKAHPAHDAFVRALDLPNPVDLVPVLFTAPHEPQTRS